MAFTPMASLTLGCKTPGCLLTKVSSALGCTGGAAQADMQNSLLGHFTPNKTRTNWATTIRRLDKSTQSLLRDQWSRCYFLSWSSLAWSPLWNRTQVASWSSYHHDHSLWWSYMINHYNTLMMINTYADDHPHCYFTAYGGSTPNWCPLMIWWSSSYDQLIIPELQVGDARHHLVGGRRRHLVRHWPDRKIDVEQEFIDFWARQGYVSSAVKQVTSDSWHLIPGTPSSKVCFTVESCKNVLKRPPSKRYPSLNSFQLVSKQTVFLHRLTSPWWHPQNLDVLISFMLQTNTCFHLWAHEIAWLRNKNVSAQ